MGNEDENIIIIQSDDGDELRLEVLDIIYNDDSNYVVGISADDEESDEVVIMRLNPINDEEDELLPIESQEELDRIFEMFKERNKEFFEFDE